ncbi:hypothetical protein Pyn_33312 [Prunus yedoensis var. nudiflora]|uniref:Uncharacterized protein n=1 Tax=Prunus yedoensis var. nudiflora TaxID=2094558 RepID=A0A314YY34_PRUYE|nr:hypothetical protein Pyn_33312 [Prunus yedoensis var. nudiflora]
MGIWVLRRRVEGGMQDALEAQRKRVENQEESAGNDGECECISGLVLLMAAVESGTVICATEGRGETIVIDSAINLVCNWCLVGLD